MPSATSTPGTNPGGISISFREWSLIVQILALLAVYGWYGLHLRVGTLTPLAAVSMLIGSTVLIILINIAAHAAIAARLRLRPEEADERDRLIELRSARNGYRVLAAAVWVVMWVGAVRDGSFAATFCAALGAFLLAELVRMGSQLFYYRAA